MEDREQFQGEVINFAKRVNLIVQLSVLRKSILNPECYVFMCDCVFVDGYLSQF